MKKCASVVICLAVLSCLALPLAAHAATASKPQPGGAELCGILKGMPHDARDSYLMTIKNVDQKVYGMTALMFACADEDNETTVAIVDALLRRGADPINIRFDARDVARIKNAQDRKIVGLYFKMKTFLRTMNGERGLDDKKPENNFNGFSAKSFAVTLGHTATVRRINAALAAREAAADTSNAAER